MFLAEFGNIKLIGSNLSGEFPASNSIFIDSGEKAVIDPAADREKLLALALQHRIGIQIHSHFHHDHTRYQSLFPNARIFAHSDEFEGYKDPDGWVDILGIGGTSIEIMWKEGLRSFRLKKPVTLGSPFEDGETFTFGDTKVVVRHAPGHTPGFCFLYFPLEGVVYTGDYDLGKFGPWYANKLSNIEKFASSSNLLYEFDAKHYITAHERGVMTKEEFLKELPSFLDIIERRSEMILRALLESPKTIEELIACGVFYPPKAHKDVWLRLSEKHMLEKHLAILERNGQIKMDGDKYFAAK